MANETVYLTILQIRHILIRECLKYKEQLAENYIER